MAPFLHCFRCGIFIAIPRQLQNYCRSCSTLWIGPSLWVGFGSIQIHHVLNNERRDHKLTTSSGSLHSTEAAYSFVPCVLLQCYWTLEIPSTHQSPLWRAFCLDFTLSDVLGPDLQLRPPHPSLAGILFAFDCSTWVGGGRLF